jgi:hypothetical protein
LGKGAAEPHVAATSPRLLAELIDLADALERRWSRIEDALGWHPPTYVHGDFKPDNIRIRRKGASELVAFDWSNGGTGVPALDVSRFLVSLRLEAGVDPPVPRESCALSIHRIAPDLTTYLTMVRPVWPRVDRNAIRYVGLVGELFHCIATIRWEAAKLGYTWIEGPIANLKLYQRWLSWLIRELAV